MKLRPLHDWAMIRRVPSADKTSGGIIIPEAAKEKPAEGIIEAIGPGRYKKEPGKKGRYVPTVLKPGQRILFTDYMAKDVEIDGSEFTFIREEDVLGLVEETGAVAIKKEHPLAEKKAQPVMVQTKPKTAPEPAASRIKKPAAKKSKPKPKKAATEKKPAKTKKSAPAKKKTKAPLKKTASKMPAATKSAKTKKAPKKTAVKKPVAKKPVKKAAAKAGPKKRN